MTLAFPLSEKSVYVWGGGGVGVVVIKELRKSLKEFDSGYVLKLTDVPIDGRLDIREQRCHLMVFGWSFWKDGDASPIMGRLTTCV